jgi:predicted amidohydrolase YtcJ
MIHVASTTRRRLLGAAALGALGTGGWFPDRAGAQDGPADLILRNARVTTLDPAQPEAAALAVRDGRFLAVGTERDVQGLGGDRTIVVDAGGRRVIPGLIDSHMHVIRSGLNYNMELRWDGLRSLADAMRMLKE